jgi:hypothetical protein
MAQHKTVSDSEFHMWRAVFAFVLVDGVLSLEEQSLLHSYRRQVPFSMAQLEILKNDFKKPQNVQEMYKKITEPEHKKRFCVLARALSWCEGDMDRQEQAILKKLDCFKSGPDADIMASTRNNPYINTFYQEYSKAGIVGMYKSAHAVQIQI